MNINKDSLVTSVCGMKSSIKLEKLFNCLEKQDSFCFGDQDRDDVIESLNDGDDGKYIQSDGYYFINSDLEFKICDHGFRNIKAEEIKLFLKDFIGNEYFIMEAIGFEFNTDHTKNLTELAHYQIDSEDIEFDEIIKNNTYDQLDKIKKENFLSYRENEKVRNLDGLGGHFPGWEDDLNYWKVYHGWVSYYIIKKGEFKKDEWWKGWNLLGPQFKKEKNKIYKKKNDFIQAIKPLQSFEGSIIITLKLTSEEHGQELWKQEIDGEKFTHKVDISYYHENHLCDFLSENNIREMNGGSIEDLLKLITKCDLDNITDKDLEELGIDSYIYIEHERWENNKDFNIDTIEFENKISKKRKKELFEKIEEQLEESGEEDVYDMWGYEDDVEITHNHIRIESIIVKTGESPDEAGDYNKNKVYEFRN